MIERDLCHSVDVDHRGVLVLVLGRMDDGISILENGKWQKGLIAKAGLAIAPGPRA